MSLPQVRPSVHVKDHSKDVWSMINETATLAEARTGRPVVNLGQGFFSYSPPDFAIQEAKKALDSPMLNQYSPTRGRQSLREALSRSYSPFFNRKLCPNTEIVVTSGANQGLYSALVAFLSPGDECIVIEPFFDQYIHNIKLTGASPVYVPLHPPRDSNTRTHSSAEWVLDFAELRAAVTPKTRMIILNTPQNPTGKILNRQELEEVGKIAVQHNLVILSDEVYDKLVFPEARATSLPRIATLSPALAKLTLTAGSAGKTFSATGWRVGWIIGDSALIEYVAAANTRICFAANSPLQEASARALVLAESNDYYASQIAAFDRKFSLFTSIWDELGLPYARPQGGYFLMVNFARVSIPSDYEFPADLEARPRDFRLAYWLIREFGVVAIPPTEFYTARNAHLAENYLRFAVCKDDHILQDAVVRLRGLKPFIAQN